MYLLEKFWSLDKNEKIIDALQSWRGRALLFVLAVPLFSVESADLFKAFLLLGLAFAFAYVPRHQDWTLLVFTQALGVYRIASSSNYFNSDVAKVMAQEQSTDMPAWEISLITYGLFMLLAWLALVYIRNRPQSLPARRPVLITVTLAFVLLFASCGGWLHGMARVFTWSFLITYCAYMWFLTFALLDQSAKARSGDAVQLGLLHPFWGSTTLPYGKGAAMMRKTRATNPHDLAVTQIKGFKLLVWAICLYGLDTVLSYFFESVLHVRSVESEISAYLANNPSPRPWLALSLVWSQLDFALWFGLWGHMVIATARFAGLRLPRSTWRPLESRTMMDYFNRILYYFKELMVDLFFTPSFLRYFKKYPRLRMFFATFMAAGIGNMLYHFLRDIDLAADMGLVELFTSFSSYAFYCVVLACAIGISQLRISAGHRPSSTVPGRIKAFVLIWGFVSLLQIFGDETRSHTLVERLHFLFYFFGLSL
jgi:hypothetical protein